MNQDQLIEYLQRDAKTNRVANAVYHVWALRKRARHQVTVHSLSQKMRKEGFEFNSSEYESMLERLSKAGVGRLERTKSGKVKALKEIKLTLQSLGDAAVGIGKRLDQFTKPNKFNTLAQMAADIKGTPDRKPVEFPISLTVVVNGKPVNFRIPSNLTTEEIADIVKRIQGAA